MSKRSGIPWARERPPRPLPEPHPSFCQPIVTVVQAEGRLFITFSAFDNAVSSVG
jgi:hypothetical protein